MWVPSQNFAPSLWRIRSVAQKGSLNDITRFNDPYGSWFVRGLWSSER